jgi:hypothetical protein
MSDWKPTATILDIAAVFPETKCPIGADKDIDATVAIAGFDRTKDTVLDAWGRRCHGAF